LSDSAVPAPSRRSIPYLYFAVFISGMTTLAVELSASRLLGSVFGTSNIVWANVIGLILLYLTIGYFIGGRWADQSPHFRTMYRIMTWAAFLSALVPLIARPVLTAAASAVLNADTALGLGSFIAVLILFSVPVTLLGTVSPFAIRLGIRNPQDAGRISGQIYAISTLGSLVGTFLPTLILIPELGTTRTFLLFAGVLFVVALIGLMQTSGARALLWLWMPIVIIVLTLLVLNGPLRQPEDGQTLLYERESAYNYIQVTQTDEGYRYLLLNEGQGVHSIYHPTQYRYDGTWDYFLTAPYFNADFTPDEVESLLVIGLAAGTIPRQYAHVYGDIPMRGIEIDPAIIEAAALFFEMNADSLPSLQADAADGRYALKQLDRAYSVIAIDAYRPPYIPWHLTTVEFFREVRDSLTENGVVAINVGRTPANRRLVDALAQVMAQVFPSVYALDVPRSFNTILYATRQPTQSENLAANLAALPADSSPLLRDVLTASVGQLVAVNPQGPLFTDDRTPVETLADSLVLNFLIYGDTSQLR